MCKNENTENKKITFLISSLAGGGAEGVCVNVANGLAENGWQVDLVVLHLNNAAYLDRVSKKVNLVNLKANNARYAFNPLKKYIKQNKTEKIVVFNYELAVMLVLIRKPSLLKFEIIARNINTLSQKRQAKGNWWRRYIVKPMIDMFYCQVDHVINQCQAMERDLLSVFPQLQGKTSVIYNPVASHVEAYAQKVDFEQIEKQNYLLCVGRLEEQKAFHYAIEAFAKIAAAYPKIRLKIVGQGSLEKDLKQLTIELNIADRVDFEGFQKNMIPYYLNARATLLTSLYEGFPNVLVESITLGTPIIAFDCQSGPSEIVVDGVNGYLVEHLNVQALGRKMESVLTEDFSYKAVNKTSEIFELKGLVSNYESVLSHFSTSEAS